MSTSGSYSPPVSGGSGIPIINGTPASPNLGDVWFDTTDNLLKFWDGAGVRILDETRSQEFWDNSQW